MASVPLWEPEKFAPAFAELDDGGAELEDPLPLLATGASGAGEAEELENVRTRLTQDRSGAHGASALEVITSSHARFKSLSMPWKSNHTHKSVSEWVSQTTICPRYIS